MGVTDLSLLGSDTDPVVWTSTPDYADIAWQSNADDEVRTVVVNGELLGDTSLDGVRIPGLRPGEDHFIQIYSNIETTPATGLFVHLPEESSHGTFLAAEAQQAADQFTESTLRLDATWIFWDTFIAPARVDAPPVGCDYGGGYQYSGNDRTWSDTPWRDDGVVNVKTRLTVIVPWDGPEVWNQDPRVPGTYAYDSATGEEVDYRATDLADVSWTANHLDGDLGSESTFVDLRLGIQAGNPFCDSAIFGNSIEGAFTMRVTRSGNYQILSGSHRQMPHHQILLRAVNYDDEIDRSTRIYQRPAASPECLVNMACPNADMTGWSGEY